jgi:catechol 2,3-dioxygenase-like lactoylglutathione lyase family enzyme
VAPGRGGTVWHKARAQPFHIELPWVQRYLARMAKVTGIGGVFLKARSEDGVLAAWYAANLGIVLDPAFGGAILRWPDDPAEDKGSTAWHVAGKDSEWFSPSRSSFMINYRVDDMAGMLARLRENGVEVIQGPESHENGKFAWVMDPDGNKVELWEPKVWKERNEQQP